MTCQTTPISLRRAATAIGWGTSRAAESRLSRYIEHRVSQGANDPRYRAGRRILVTLRRLLAALPELDKTQGELALDSVPQAQPNQLLELMRTVAREECGRCRRRPCK